MIKDPLLEAHVKAIFIHNIHPELRFITMDYVDFSFSNIVHKLIQKKECMVEMGKMKYDNPPKDQQKLYPKKEDRHVQVAKGGYKSSNNIPHNGDAPRGNEEKEYL